MYDYIIVGQGIAGTILAHTFIKNKKKVLIVNQSRNDSPSAVAAGIYNPITGKRIVKTWKAHLLFPFLESFYSELEFLLHETFLHKMPIYKSFNSFAEQNYLLAEKDFGFDFCNLSTNDVTYKNLINNEFGGFETKFSGYVHVKKMLSSSKSFFVSENSYLEENLNYDDLILKDDHVIYKSFKAKKIIFCDGPFCKENHFFNWLPFVFTKGEILEIEIQNFPQNVIFNKSVFLMPNDSNQYKVGSTYKWEFADNNITEEGKIYLQDKLEDLLIVDYKITDQRSGIRPTVKDRRPFVGIHPKFKPLGIFNGLGTKGISLAPYYANHFFDSLENGKILDPEVDIKRFYSLA